MRLSDFVIDRIAKEGVKKIFMVSGGGGMYLIDSLGRRNDIDFVCNHHEQASSMCAEAYQRVTGNLGVALVTTGPAGTNAITGLMCAWNDSIPLLFLSGQANSKVLINDTGLRQRGTHEANITKIVESVTKYAVTVRNENEIRYHMEKAIYLARNGRPGPVWIDIPLDIQSKEIDPEKLTGFDPVKEDYLKKSVSSDQILKVFELIETAKRPVIIAGHGIRLSGAVELFNQFIDKYKIPVVTPKNGFDLIFDEHPLLAGRIGINGQRAGNFAVQNSDFLLILGSRLAFTAIGYDTHNFAREAKKVLVDIDPAQISYPNIKPDVSILADVKDVITELDRLFIERKTILKTGEWILKCQYWRKLFPVITDEINATKNYINSYLFFDRLSEFTSEDDIVITDQGATFYSITVALRLKKGQRAFTNGGFSPMGYGLPASIGACFANNKKQVVSVNGDGGLQMNIQELQTIVHHQLPIKVFVFNNEGYLSIKHTQTSFFNGFFVGSDGKSGVTCPDIIKVGQAYGLKTFRMCDQESMDRVFKEIFAFNGPALIEVMLDPLQTFQPKVTSERKPDGKMVSKPFEDMWPFIDRELLKKEMIVKPIE